MILMLSVKNDPEAHFDDGIGWMTDVFVQESLTQFELSNGIEIRFLGDIWQQGVCPLDICPYLTNENTDGVKILHIAKWP